MVQTFRVTAINELLDRDGTLLVVMLHGINSEDSNLLTQVSGHENVEDDVDVVCLKLKNKPAAPFVLGAKYDITIAVTD